ncbi:four helix bundle protein [Nostoc sp. UHCC 0702]|nr:four helix bundle protein [Nostoc sp. UHCC 0702]
MRRELIKSHEDLEVYQLAFDIAMQIFDVSKKFPIEEKYSVS